MPITYHVIGALRLQADSMVGPLRLWLIIEPSIICIVIWTSLVAQIVKNLPAMRETWVCSLGWEDPLEENMQPKL